MRLMLGLNIDQWIALYKALGPVIAGMWIYLIYRLVKELAAWYREERYHGTYEIRGRRHR